MRRSEAELTPTPTNTIELKKTAKKLKQGRKKSQENHGTTKKYHQFFTHAQKHVSAQYV